MIQSSTNSIRGLRQLRTRTVLLAGTAFVVLIYLTSAYYYSSAASEHIAWISSAPSQASDTTVQQRSPCWSQWFSTGTVCANPPEEWTQQAKLDLIWTWANASLNDEPGSSDDSQRAHARETASDFLRYSLRSAQQYMHGGFGSVTLLTPDVPTSIRGSARQDACTHDYRDAQGRDNSGQRPCWLATEDPLFEPPRLLHRRQVACAGHDDRPPSEFAGRWIDQHDSFSSAVLAAQVPELSDVRLLIAPHHVFALPVSASDFWSPLYGAAFRFQLDSQVYSAAPSSDPGLKHLQAANALLDRRFGVRPRAKLLDLPIPVSSSAMAEMRQIWPDLLHSNSSPTSAQLDLPFLAAHYLLERHREALLWSFIVAKHDRDADGFFSPGESEALLTDLGLDPHHPYAAPSVKLPERKTTSPATVNANLHRARLPRRLGPEAMQSSMDGLAFVIPPASDPTSDVAAPQQEGVTSVEQMSPACVLERECIAPLLDAAASPAAPDNKPSATSMFSRVAFHAPMCGDCIITHLVGKSGQLGLSAFLPAPELKMAAIETLPLNAHFGETDHSLRNASSSNQATRLDQVSRLLSRYAHTVVQQPVLVAPNLSTPLDARESLITLELLNTSSLFSFKQHPSPSEAPKSQPQEAWMWPYYVRAWLSLRFPFPMRFESPTNKL